MDIIKKFIVLNWVFIVVAAAGLVFDLASKEIVFSAHDAEIGLRWYEAKGDFYREINRETFELKSKADKKEDDEYDYIERIEVLNREDAETIVISGFFDLQCTMNPGGMWGILPQKTVLLIVFSILCIGVIGFMVTRLDPTQLFMRISLGLILAGAFGNLYDRLIYLGVRDFIVFHLPVINVTWPAFNVADIWIVVGVFMIVALEIFFAPKKKEEDKKGKSKSGKATTTA